MSAIASNQVRPTMSSTPVSPQAARFSTNSLFFVCGLLFATWGVHVPTVKALYALSDAGLSWLMLSAGVGALLGLSQVGQMVARYGTRPVIWATGIGMCISLAVLLFAPGYPALLAVLFVYGLCNGSFDVAMNAEAVAVEHAYRRPIMSSFHGFFSLGGFAGALAGSMTAAMGIAPWLHLAGSAVGGFVVIAVASRWMLPPEATHSPEEAGRTWSLPKGIILLIGVMGALGMVGEGAMYDWSTLYMRDELHSTQQIAALGYGAFSVAMALARFGGDWVRARLGSSEALRLSAWVAAAAMTLTLVLGLHWTTLLGFAVVGLGFANVVPVLFSAAARVPGVTPAKGIAGVSAVGYVGFMMGPPVIGAIAHRFSLSSALFIVALFAMAVALLTRRAMAQVGEEPGAEAVGLPQMSQD
ncbi:MFS transporter [Uliginosibacterium gangwonense]|uniref:MFS transporter n=1 Tax=Uliginosibacterium gangwonense TaxID=392736 RepID=UPI000366B153|nr:MFS transporter [Uliginosibacterium gangwonense]